MSEPKASLLTHSLTGDLVCFTFGAFGGLPLQSSSDQSHDLVCILCIPKMMPREGEKAAVPVPDFRQPASLPVRLLNNLRVTVC